MSTLNTARENLDTFLKAQNDFEEYFELFIQKKLECEVLWGFMSKSDANNEFTYDAELSTYGKICFSSEGWVETWAGGRADIPGIIVSLDEDFIENADRYVEEAKRANSIVSIPEWQQARDNERKRRNKLGMMVSA